MVKEKDSKNIEKLKAKSRRHSIKEGIFASAKVSFADHYIAPFAIAINASNSLVALLSAITGLLGPLSQTLSSRLMEKSSRKKIVLRAILLETLMIIPFIIIAFLFYKGILTNLLPILLLISFSLYIAFSNIAVAPWFSWMGDIVNERYRGRWFSKRNLIMGFVSVVLAISASFFLDYFKKIDLAIFGFMILFFLAFIARLICFKIFKKQYEPKIELKEGYYFSFWDFIINSPKNNFGKLALFRSIFTFTTSISSPLLVVYLLRNLNFQYSQYMIIIFSGTVFSLIMLGIWGKLADRYGNYTVLCLTSIIIPIIPFLWILNSSILYLIFIPSLLSGISWAGFRLAERNFIYDNISQEKRGIAISYYHMLWGLGMFLGAGLGAILIKFLSINVIEPIIAIFILGGIARMIVVFWWMTKIKEIKKKKKFKSSKVLKDIIFKEAKPTLLEEAHDIISIKEYINSK